MNPITECIESILATAVEITSVAERRAFIDRASAGNAELQRRVDELVENHFRAGDFLETPAFPWTAQRDEPICERAGSVIGSFKLLEQIGEGGFGVVFLAEQTAPVRRQVALKVIKPGMDTRQVIARFEAERQALAVMDHPHIARVLEAGATASGRPYFVMELVRGLPITAYCDEHNLPVRERLELFATICQAIQHAHTKGIIHRDIKPTNLLVTRQDGRPVVKVIDFGVAKAVGGQLTEKTLFTAFAQMIGTPLYMSPEQVELSSLDIDTRSDIYSLGVLLYELLTGSTPVDKEVLKQAAFDEIRRIIREDEPPMPSVRIGGSETLPAIAASRRTEPARLGRLVRGELDWIVMKCLDKDRSRRYETASDLAADLGRYLSNEPVQACPPSAWRRFCKLARRRRGAFLTAAALIVGVLVILAMLADSNLRIRREHANTDRQRRRAEDALRLAEGRAAEVHQGLERLKAANALLDRGRWYAHEQHWNDAHVAFTKAIELHPEHTSAWLSRADLLVSLGLWDLASDDFVREFELREPETPTRWYRHALLRLYLGHTNEYRQIRRKMQARFEGTVNYQVGVERLRASILAPEPDDSEALVLFAQRISDARPNDWFRLYVLGIAHYRAGQHEQAVQRLTESLTGGPEWPGRPMSYPALAMAQHRLGRTTEARQALDAAAKAIDAWTQQVYESSPIGSSLHQGAVVEWPIAWWDWLECQVYYREAAELLGAPPLSEDPRLHVLRARAFVSLRRNFSADVEYAQALKERPDDRLIRSEAHRSAAYSALARGRWSHAAAEFARATELNPEDPILWRYQAIAHLAADDADAYRQTCRAMLDRFATTADWQAAGNVMLACVLRGDAVSDMDRLLPLAPTAAPWHHLGGYVRGAALYRSGNYHEAVECFVDEARVYRPRAWDWAFLAMAHQRLGHHKEAERCLAQAADWIEKANLQASKDPSGFAPSWGNWQEPVVYPLLLREAQELVQPTLAPAAQHAPQRN